jgi:restriction endonuclease S subunit
VRLKDVATVIVSQASPLFGDILVSLRPPGAVAIANQGDSISRGHCAIRGTRADAGYLYWWLVSMFPWMNAAASVSRDDLAGLAFPAIDVAEQRAIADFLGRETAEIDAVIAGQEELITLLRERRTAAIARSLDAAWTFPTVPLKRLVSPGQLSEFLGMVSGSASPVLPAFAPGFADALLRSPRLVAEYRIRSTGTHAQLGAIRVPVPPIPEQNEIVERLERETSAIDSVIADAGSAIALSRERRAALISAAVAGTVDVDGERAA